MIVKEYYSTRKDGVKLYRTVDALTDENGKVLLESIYNENGKVIGERAIPRGFYILQNETGIEYAEAIDVENAPYTYSETDKPIEDTSGWTQEQVEEPIEA